MPEVSSSFSMDCFALRPSALTPLSSGHAWPAAFRQDRCMRIVSDYSALLMIEKASVVATGGHEVGKRADRR